MMELGLDARLVEKAREKGAVVVVIATHRFDDDGALGALDADHRREEDLTHSTASDALQQAEALELTWQAGLRGWVIFP
jgi:hypothetical protein